jgi:hypothetical protein
VTSSPFLRAVAISSGRRGMGSDITFPESSCHTFWKKREEK